MSSYNLDNRVIRVFISSTFRDMQDERDELMKKTFPVLRRKAAERDVTLTELDLRWGITPEESESGKVVEICLREIENSVPFFVGIIGNRYGWIPSPGDLGESLRERFSQVDGYVERQLSVTEMEMQFGVLERTEDMHAFFFIKEQEADDVDEPEKLAALKSAVRSNGRYPVSTYSSPEDLAGQVEEAFTKLLDELYPEGALSELEKEHIGQRAYLNSLCQNYIRTDANFAVIDEWMADWEKHQLVITGASGLGKSALVANWVKEKLVDGKDLPYRIIHHFVGNGGSTGSHGHVIKVLCNEIRDRYGFETDSKEDMTDEKALEELINRVAAEGDKPLLIVLDAINQIIDVDNSKQLNWLPIPPKNVKILFTTLDDDRTMEVFKNRHYPVFKLQPLTKKQREEMVRGYLSIFSKKLQPHQVERIVNDKQCENTLVLKTLLDELINFGIFQKLDEKIGTYLGTSSVEEFYGILLKGYEVDFGESFVKHILSLIAVSRNGLSEEEILAITKETPLHWSQFFCAIRQHLVVKNGLVSYAHSYIRKAVEERYLQGQEDWGNACRKEIVAYFNGAKTHRAMDEVPYQYDILDDLDNLHKYLMDLTVFSYLDKVEDTVLGTYWHRLIEKGRYSLEEYLPLVDNLTENKRPDFLSALSSFTRCIVVVPKLSLRFAEDALMFVHEGELQAELLNLCGLSCGILGDYKTALNYEKKGLEIRLRLFGRNNYYTAMSFNNIGRAYGNLGDIQMELKNEMEALDICRSVLGETHPNTAIVYNNIGLTYSNFGEFGKALENQFKALDIKLAAFGNGVPDTALSYISIGSTYDELGDYIKALEFQNRALDIYLTVFGETHPNVAMSYNNIGLVYGHLGDYVTELDYLQKALRIRLIVFGESHSLTATSYGNLSLTYSNLGDYQKAMSYQQKALEIRQNVYGLKHPDTALAYVSTGYLFGETGNYEEALRYQFKALDLYLSIFGDTHPDIAMVFNNIGYYFKESGNNQKGLEYYLKALSQCISIYGEIHPHTMQVIEHVGNLYWKLGKFNEALEYRRKELNIKKQLEGENTSEVAFLYNNIGACYGKLGNVNKEIEMRLKALGVVQELQDKQGIAIFLNRVGKTFKSIGQIETANDYFRQAAEKYRELGDEEQAEANLKEIIE